MERRQKELEREKEEKGAKERKEKLEVRCDPRLVRWDAILTPPQREKKQKELEREKEEKEARELKEKLEVRCGFHLFRQDTTLTLLQKEKRRNELEREKKEKERRGKLEVCCSPISPEGISLQPYCRRKGGNRNLSERRERRKHGNARKNSKYDIVPISSNRTSF